MRAGSRAQDGFWLAESGKGGAIDTTHPSLLLRVRRPDDQAAWREFFELYFPLLERFGRRCGLDRHEAEEVAQECMEALARSMRGFEYSPGRGRFRSYLFKMVSNKIYDRRSRRQPRRLASTEMRTLKAHEDPSRPAWDEHWLREHLKFVLTSLEPVFAEGTVTAFKLYVLKGLPAEEVAEKLGMTTNQVYLAKSRVTARLRKELTDTIGQVV